MSGAATPVETFRTTHATIALSYLDGRIDGLERFAARGEMENRAWLELIDLVTLRAQTLGRIADYERASLLAEQRTEVAPGDELAFLSRARTRASLHRFAEAMVDLDLAAALGLAGREIEVDKAAILQAVGRYAEAMAIRRCIADNSPDFEAAAGLASLYADIGDTDAAERWFDESSRRYRSVSPFALAQLEFQRGHMWMSHDPVQAHRWLLAAWQRLPCYAQAEGHLAEVEEALGDRNAAIARLERLAAESDDPDFAAELARVLWDAGRRSESAQWRGYAEKRYETLIAWAPAAFADHGARFWLSVGGEPGKALALARLNLEVRDTPKARRLFDAALAACGGGVYPSRESHLPIAAGPSRMAPVED
jgi:tetratricopeptide (TPR) repeat protein